VTHFAIESPNPDKAPYLPAAFGSKQMLAKNPTQLKKKAIINALRNMHSLPISLSIDKESAASACAIALNLKSMSFLKLLLMN
jgi:hypothetical protein